jgi:hypothetical protein
MSFTAEVQLISQEPVLNFLVHFVEATFKWLPNHLFFPSASIWFLHGLKCNCGDRASSFPH